ncbi:MAG: hypothetical protein P8016_13990 [Sedimentisphaerales bacterium]
MRNRKQIRRAVVLFVPVILAIPLWAATSDYRNDAAFLSQQLVDAANDLKQETGRPDIDSVEVDYLLDEIKGLISDYENVLVFAAAMMRGWKHCAPAGMTVCSKRYGSGEQEAVRGT